MKLTELFLEELDREAARTRRALEHVPHDRDDWKPHPKSTPLGRLAGLVASKTNALVAALDQHVAKARDVLKKIVMNNCIVPSIYGPSADDQRFA